MDETQHIWRVLQATEPRRSRPGPDMSVLAAQLESAREEKMVRAKAKAKAKKRRLESESKEQVDDVGKPG